MLLSNLANTVTLLMHLFEKSAETSIISAEDSTDRCGSVPSVNVTVILHIVTRLLSHVFYFSNDRPSYHSKLQSSILETLFKKKSVPFFKYVAK
jgi:hypothetical protein